jgi:hypothetical protein
LLSTSLYIREQENFVTFDGSLERYSCFLYPERIIPIHTLKLRKGLGKKNQCSIPSAPELRVSYYIKGQCHELGILYECL